MATLATESGNNLQCVQDIGPGGGTLQIPNFPNVKLIFPAGALLKTVNVGLEIKEWQNSVSSQIPPTMAMGHLISIKPVRRKFHTSLTLALDEPECDDKRHKSQLYVLYNFYPLDSSDPSSSVWEVITSGTELYNVRNKVVHLRTTVSANYCLVSSYLSAKEVTSEFNKLFALYKNSASLDQDLLLKYIQAARDGDLNTVVECLDGGSIPIDSAYKTGLAALHFAAKKQLSVVDELVSRKADVNLKTPKGNTPLAIACLAGQLDIVRCLIKNGANVNIHNLDGMSGLYMAAQEGHSDIVKCLIENGVKLTATTEDGFSAFDVALQQDKWDIVEMLLDALKEEDDPQKLQLIISNNPALNRISRRPSLAEKDKKLLQLAGPILIGVAARQLKEDIKSIQTVQNENIKNFLQSAYSGDVSGVRSYFSGGNVMEPKTQRGMTALHCACLAGHEEIVKLLIENNHQINARTDSGFTPLFLAVQEGYLEVVKLLLSNKADPRQTDKNNLYPLMVARIMSHSEVVDALLSAITETT